jgi:hypothetical protein
MAARAISDPFFPERPGPTFEKMKKRKIFISFKTPPYHEYMVK